MGMFFQEFAVGPKNGSRREEITALVDTGSIYTLIPGPFLDRVGVVPEWSSVFELADGSQVEYSVAEVVMRLGAEERTTVCIFGPPDCDPLLGVVALESFGLAADPVNQKLVPAKLPLK